VSMEISHETEARLADEARKQGISVEALLERLMSERGATAHVAGNGSTPKVPILASRNDGASPPAGHLRQCPLSRECSMRTFCPTQ